MTSIQNLQNGENRQYITEILGASLGHFNDNGGLVLCFGFRERKW